MAESRAIDQLCKAFNVEQRSSYTIKNGKEVVLKLYWKPLTISDRDRINNSLKALKRCCFRGQLGFCDPNGDL